MAGRNRDGSGTRSSERDWLGLGHASRRRRWALEEQLLGPGSETADEGLLEAVSGQLSERRAAVAELETERNRQRARVAALEQRLEAIALGERGSTGPPVERQKQDDRPSRPVLRLGSTRPPDDDYWLSRCEGFLVEAPSGRGVGVVVGFRFALHIDRPDLLEVEVGRLHRTMLLVPVDEVEHISADKELVVLKHDPLHRRDLAHELVARIREKFPVSPSA